MSSERRSGETEAAFRAVNERIEELAEEGTGEPRPITILCECSRATCVERLELVSSEYDRIRSDPELFFLRPGHDDPDVETVAERTAEYLVVRKTGVAASAARAHDPRAD